MDSVYLRVFSILIVSRYKPDVPSVLDPSSILFVCLSRFTLKAKLEHHMAEVHAVGGGGPGSASSAASQSECDICGAHFADQDTLRRHRQKPHLIACKVLNFS